MLKINCQCLFKKFWWKYTWLRVQIHRRFTISLRMKSQWYLILGIKDGPSQKCFLWSTNFCSYSNSTCRYLKYNVSSILPSLLDFLCMYCHLAEKKKTIWTFFPAFKCHNEWGKGKFIPRPFEIFYSWKFIVKVSLRMLLLRVFWIMRNFCLK